MGLYRELQNRSTSACARRASNGQLLWHCYRRCPFEGATWILPAAALPLVSVRKGCCGPQLFRCLTKSFGSTSICASICTIWFVQEICYFSSTYENTWSIRLSSSCSIKFWVLCAACDGKESHWAAIQREATHGRRLWSCWGRCLPVSFKPLW